MKRVLLALTLAAIAVMPALGVVMYNNTTDTGIPSFSNLDPGAVILDDVGIPVARLNGTYKMNVKQMMADVYAPIAGTYTVRWWYSIAVNDGMGKPTPTIPPTQLTSQNVTMAQNERKTLTVGDGTNILFSPTLLPVALMGNKNGLVFVGLSFNTSLNGMGWATANGPDLNDNTFYGYYGAGDVRNGYKILGGGPGVWSSFNLKILGDPIVPEPATVAVFTVCGSFLIARRRR